MSWWLLFGSSVPLPMTTMSCWISGAGTLLFFVKVLISSVSSFKVWNIRSKLIYWTVFSENSSILFSTHFSAETLAYLVSTEFFTRSNNPKKFPRAQGLCSFQGTRWLFYACSIFQGDILCLALALPLIRDILGNIFVKVWVLKNPQ